jgi:peptide/nickel transport system permease protein
LASFRRVLVKRLFNAFITIVMIMALNYILFRVMPGDPARLLVPRDPNADTQAIYERNLKEFGLDTPPLQQVILYFTDTFTGHWGTSYVYKRPVIEVMGGAISWTMLLLGVSSVLTFLLGIILGKTAAYRRGKPADVAISSFGLFRHQVGRPQV